METNATRALSTTAQLIGLIVALTPRNIRCKHIALLLRVAEHPGLTLNERSKGMLSLTNSWFHHHHSSISQKQEVFSAVIPSSLDFYATGSDCLRCTEKIVPILNLFT